jgi:thioesterase domain-containing protein
LLRPPLEKLWKVSGGLWVDSEREYVYHDNQWGQYMPDLEIVEVSGDHDSMVLVPHVRNLAAKLRSRLASAEDATAHPAPSKISVA